MRHTNRHRRYASPVMKLLTYEQALAKVESEQLWANAAQKLPVIVLEVLLSVLPAMVLLSVIDPSGLLRRTLLAASPVVWAAWAVLCLYASLSSEELIRKVSTKSPRGNGQSIMLLLGLANCVAAVSWLGLMASEMG